MGITTLTNFASDFFYNSDGTLTSEARAVVYGVMATVGTAAAGVAGSALTHLWSKCTSRGEPTAPIGAGNQTGNKIGCISRLFKSCTETSMNMISYAAKKSWKMINSQRACRVVGVTSTVALTMIGGNYAFDLSFSSTLTGSAILLATAALALSPDGGSKRPKTKRKAETVQQNEIKIPNQPARANIVITEVYETPGNVFDEDEDDKVHELPSEQNSPRSSFEIGHSSHGRAEEVTRREAPDEDEKVFELGENYSRRERIKKIKRQNNEKLTKLELKLKKDNLWQ